MMLITRLTNAGNNYKGGNTMAQERCRSLNVNWRR